MDELPAFFDQLCGVDPGHRIAAHYNAPRETRRRLSQSLKSLRLALSIGKAFRSKAVPATAEQELSSEQREQAIQRKRRTSIEVWTVIDSHIAQSTKGDPLLPALSLVRELATPPAVSEHLTPTYLNALTGEDAFAAESEAKRTNEHLPSFDLARLPAPSQSHEQAPVLLTIRDHHVLVLPPQPSSPYDCITFFCEPQRPGSTVFDLNLPQHTPAPCAACAYLCHIYTNYERLPCDQHLPRKAYRQRVSARQAASTRVVVRGTLVSSSSESESDSEDSDEAERQQGNTTAANSGAHALRKRSTHTRAHNSAAAFLLSKQGGDLQQQQRRLSSAASASRAATPSSHRRASKSTRRPSTRQGGSLRRASSLANKHPFNHSDGTGNDSSSRRSSSVQQQHQQHQHQRALGEVFETEHQRAASSEQRSAPGSPKSKRSTKALRRTRTSIGLDKHRSLLGLHQATVHASTAEGEATPSSLAAAAAAAVAALKETSSGLSSSHGKGQEGTGEGKREGEGGEGGEDAGRHESAGGRAAAAAAAAAAASFRPSTSPARSSRHRSASPHAHRLRQRQQRAGDSQNEDSTADSASSQVASQVTSPQAQRRHGEEEGARIVVFGCTQPTENSQSKQTKHKANRTHGTNRHQGV